MFRPLLLLPLLFACGGEPAKGDSAGDSDSETNVDLAVCEQPTEVACEDTMIQDLSFHEEVSEGEVTTTADGEDFVTYVDASAGGYNDATNNPWVYLKFTEAGAERVDIDDESSLTSMDWDMSVRRFIVRLNGGSSGPSCVGATGLLEQSYADVTSVAEGTEFYQDDYYTSDCTIKNDSSGLPDSPQVALGAWWTYPGCVATSEVPFLIQLADGHVLKLVVESYYGEEQADCNDDGSSNASGGFYYFRWQMLQ